MADDLCTWTKSGSEIENRYDETKCLDISGCNDDDGATINSYEKHGGSNQQWYFNFV